MNQNQNQKQQASDRRHDDDAALSDFLASLMDYTPTIPDKLVEHYLAKSGFQCPDVRLLVAVATQKFVAEVASDSLQQCKARQATIVKDKRDKQQKDKRQILTMEDLSRALREALRVVIQANGERLQLRESAEGMKQKHKTPTSPAAGNTKSLP
ncbi:transcription initiation factor TFIID subunit 10-like isoform X2 [Fagus crenata]